MMYSDLVGGLFGDFPRAPRNRPLVLIADDSPTVRIVTRHALERAGLQTIEVASPLAVIAAAWEVVPELFLLDITYAIGAPMNGYQVCRLLRDLPQFRETPILLVSGRDGIVDRVRGRFAGATGYITKPFKMAELMARVRQLADEEWRRREDGASPEHRRW
jgi:twitching motility two-component system response regulator PilG